MITENEYFNKSWDEITAYIKNCKFHLPFEDKQEAILSAIIYAVRTYNPSRYSFKEYRDLCAEHFLMEYKNEYNKHYFENCLSLSLDAPLTNDCDTTFGDMLACEDTYFFDDNT